MAELVPATHICGSDVKSWIPGMSVVGHSLPSFSAPVLINVRS
jgi:hypothetical protein